MLSGTSGWARVEVSGSDSTWVWIRCLVLAAGRGLAWRLVLVLALVFDLAFVWALGLPFT